VLAEFGRSLEASEWAPVSAARTADAARQQVVLSFARGKEGRVAVTMTFRRMGHSEWRIGVGAISDAALPESVKRALDGGPPSTAFPRAMGLETARSLKAGRPEAKLFRQNRPRANLVGSAPAPSYAPTERARGVT